LATVEPENPFRRTGALRVVLFGPLIIMGRLAGGDLSCSVNLRALPANIGPA
jgi:hypothetical protein